MYTYEIYFHGLVCFYAPEGRYGARDYKTKALFVRDPSHKRVVATADGYFGTGFTSISTSLGAGRARVLPHFQEFVPHLSDAGITRSNFDVNPVFDIALDL